MAPAPRGVRRLVAAAALSTVAAVPALAQELSYSGSLGFSTGSYIFEQRTNTWLFNNGLTFRIGSFRVTGGIPVAIQNSGAVNLVGDIWVPAGGPDNGAVRQRAPGEHVPMGKGGNGQGGRGAADVAFALIAAADTVSATGSYQVDIADPLLYGGYELYTSYDVIRAIELTAAVKPPLSSLESGVGTGEWDWSAGVSLTASAGRALLFGDASWWSYGDLPDLELRDGASWGIGVGVPVGRRASVLGSISSANALIATARAPLSLAVAGSWSLEDGRAVNGGLSIGLSEASPAFGVFVGWRLDLISRRPVM